MSGVRRLTADEGFASSILAAVAAATVFAFGVDATADVVASMLMVGGVTALAETKLGSGRKS